MPNPHLSILVVDDAKFSCAMIGRTLTQAGYRDVRVAENAAQAIVKLSERPASVLLADWQMPEMDGLELAAHVRRLDESNGHYTYVILLTGREGEKVLNEAFNQGVDDFISKTVMNEQLLPRMFAAERLCGTLQQLLQEKTLLRKNIASLEEHNLIDPVTGLGNSRYLKKYLHNSLRRIESRGGALCYLLISIQNTDGLLRRYGTAFYHDLLNKVARRLEQLVRPLDLLVSPDDRHFVLIVLLSDLETCSHRSFKHVQDGINLRPLKTSEGFINIKADFALLGVDSRALPIDPEQFMEQAKKLVQESRATQRFTALRLAER